MIKIDNSTKAGNQHIRILYPGLSMNKTDTGFHTLGRIDHAQFPPGALIAMHPHANDDILTYLRSGKVKHTDSEGFTEYIEPTRLMLMKAGSSFFHEEQVLESGGTLEALQIFIRPKEKATKPVVSFYNLENKYSENAWRLLASPAKSTPLQFSSDTWLYDMKVRSGTDYALPELPSDNSACLLYIFNGQIEVNDGTNLSRGESLLIQNEAVTFSTKQEAEVVLFVTSDTAIHYDEGMYSGNQR